MAHQIFPTGAIRLYTDVTVCLGETCRGRVYGRGVPIREECLANNMRLKLIPPSHPSSFQFKFFIHSSTCISFLTFILFLRSQRCQPWLLSFIKTPLVTLLPYPKISDENSEISKSFMPTCEPRKKKNQKSSSTSYPTLQNGDSRPTGLGMIPSPRFNVTMPSRGLH